MLLTKLFIRLLRPVYGQTVVDCVTGVKTDNVMVAFHVLFSLVLAVFQIGAHTRYSEIIIDRGSGGNRAYARPKEGLLDKFGLAYHIHDDTANDR